jgi:hypothetical protein
MGGDELTTRLVERLPGRTRFPDLKMLLHGSHGKTYVIISEHKWDSPIRQSQLADYEEILQSMVADYRHLATIVARAGGEPRVILSYKVYVDDNFHYMEEEHRYFLGEFLKGRRKEGLLGTRLASGPIKTERNRSPRIRYFVPSFLKDI